MSCFNNAHVETAVSKALADAEVHVYCGYVLAQWDLSEDDGDVTSVSFTSDSTPLVLDCVVSS